MYIDAETEYNMLRTARKQVKLGPTVPFDLPADPFKGISDGDPDEEIEEDPEEDPEEGLEEDPEEEPSEASRSGSNTWPLDFTAPNEKTDSDLDSTTRSGAGPKDLEDTCEKMAPYMRNNPNNNGENPNIVEIIAQQLQAIIPQIVTQVTNNVNNRNRNGGNRNGGNGNGGNNNGCTYKEFLACKTRYFDGKGGAIVVTRWIEKMESTRGREDALGMTWEDFKALFVEKFYPRNEMEKLESEFWNHAMVGANHAADNDKFHELAKLVPHLVTPESKRIDKYIHGQVPQICGMIRATQPSIIQGAILKAGALNNEAIRCGTLSKIVEKRKEAEGPSKQGGSWSDKKRGKAAPINVVRMGNSQRACYECESPYHLRNICPKLNRAQVK
ncbi:reverse transcriptase domain-containing protein [Tanacetum coccineum]